MQGYYDLPATPATDPFSQNDSREPLTDDDLSGIIEEQIQDSTAYEESDLSRKRRKAIAYFEGDSILDGDVPYAEGRSSVVSMDLADTHGWIMPSLLRTLAGGDNFVIYEATRPDNEQKAKEATDYINYTFITECGGYRILHDAISDGLLLGNGMIKHYWDPTPEYRVETRTGLPETEFIALAHDPNVEILQHTARPDGPSAPVHGMHGAEPAGMSGPPGLPEPPAAGSTPGQQPPMGSLVSPGAPMGGQPPMMAGMMQPEPLYLHDVKIRMKVNDGHLCVNAFPQEEFRINRGATQLDEEHVTFCAHVSLVTRSSLVEEGYDRDLVDDIVAFTGTPLNERNRFGAWSKTAPSTDDSTDIIQRWECYVKIDYDNDGIAELRRVVAAGSMSDRTILYNEEWTDDLPFTDFVPDPIPFLWRGTSLYDRVGDLQRIKTVFARGINDNLYWVNNPQREAVTGQIENPQQLSNPSYGGTLWVRAPGSVRDLTVPFIADKLMAGMDMIDRVREFRTGVSAQTMSLDPEALSNQTATAVNAAATASYSKIETYARNLAEIGMKRLFRCLLRLIVKHQDKARTIQVRGKWVEMNPASWDPNMDAIIRVGLGTGSRQMDISMLGAIAAKQEAFIAKATPPVSEALGMGVDKLFHTYRLMVEASNLKSPELFFPELPQGASAQILNQLQQQQAQQGPTQDPHTQAKVQAIQMETQAKAQAQQQAQEAQAAQAQQKIQYEWQARQQQAAIDNQHRAAELASQHEAKLREIELAHVRAEADAQRKFDLAQQEMSARNQLKMYELQKEAELKREQMAMQADVAPNIEQAH